METIVPTRVAGLRVDAIPNLDGVVELVTNSLLARHSFLMTFANPGTATAAARNNAAELFERFTVVAPDGIAMAKAVAWRSGKRAERISFDSTSLALPVLGLAAKRGDRVVLVGGADGVARTAGAQWERAFPGLNVVGCLHGYRPLLDLVAATLELKPDIVICGMGGLLQERFLLALADAQWSGVGFTCGGYLDQCANGLRYYPKVVDALHLRFAYRLVKEPRRLWRRYLLDYPTFAMSLCKGMFQSETHEHRRHS